MILFALDKQPDLTLAAVLCWFLPSSAVSASTPHFFPYLLALDQPQGLSWAWIGRREFWVSPPYRILEMRS